MLELQSRNSRTASRSASATSPDHIITRASLPQAHSLAANPDSVPVALRPLKGTNGANKTLNSVTSRDEDKQSTVLETRKRTRDGKPATKQASREALRTVKVIHSTNHQELPCTNGTPLEPSGNAHAQFQSHHATPNIISSSTTSERQSKKGEETRSLRSKAGSSRLKSDLATYFSNFDDVISGLPQSPEFVGLDEPILITDVAPNPPQPKLQTSRLPFHTKPSFGTPSFGRIDLFALAPVPITSSPSTDPLDDSVFLPSHRRAERREKQLRNIEKERAQHEKGQLETLLDALQGPDWLKAMGVTGVTDGARKEYEPKRDYFVREVRALLKKFSVWKEAEKRLLMEKVAREEEDEEDEEEDAEGGAGDELDTEDDLSTSDADGWAARQLRLEARSANSKVIRPKSWPRLKVQLPPKPPEPPKPFTSFYSKPHMRAAALAQGRPGRRTVLAFGHAIPDTPYEMEFNLPDDFLTPEVLMAQARKRRRMNREKREAAMAKEKALN